MAGPSLIGMTQEELVAAAQACGGKSFHGRQLCRWLYGRRETDPSRWTDLPLSLRENLGAAHGQLTSRVIACEESGEGTDKLGIRLQDGPVIETVLMREPEGNTGRARLTACISTQAGCAMGCRFCASGKLGLKRHLTAGEILEQFFHLAARIRETSPVSQTPPEHDWLTNVVFMGMGEPLHNFDALTKALTVLNADWGFAMGARRFTISTVGLPDRIRQLADFGVPVNLAVSLHAVDDETRTALIPTNVATGLTAILEASAEYFEKTRREVTFEYTLIRGDNDSPEQAAKLVSLLRGFPRANVNLIPMNPVEDSGLKTPGEEAVAAFREVLLREGINAHERKRRGRAVQAACGQLRLKLEATA